MFGEKCVIIKRQQDLSLDELEEALKKVSKEVRESLYKNGEFLSGINEIGFYIFCFINNEYGIDYILELLREEGVIAYSAKPRELKNRLKNEIPEEELIAICDGVEYKPKKKG